MSGFKKQVLKFYFDVIKPTFKNLFTIIGYLILIAQFIVIFLGIKIKILEDYRMFTVWTAIFFITTSFIYYLFKTRFKEAEGRIQNQMAQLNEQYKIQMKQLTDLLNEKPKNPKDDIKDNLTYHDVEFAIYCLTKQIVDDKFFESEYLFNWKEVPGKDEERLKNFLVKFLNIEWIQNAKIYNNGSVITISEGANYCSISLNDERNMAILKIDNLRNQEFIVRTENDNLCLYKKFDAKKNIIIGVDRGGAVIGGMLAKNFGLAIKTLAVAYGNQPKRIQGIETSIAVGECLRNIELDNITRILLIDDAIRTGESMVAARILLNQILNQKERANAIQVKSACILHEMATKRLFNPDYSIYTTTQLNIKLPWDKMHWYEEMLLEKNDKIKFEELCNKI